MRQGHGGRGFTPGGTVLDREGIVLASDKNWAPVPVWDGQEFRRSPGIHGLGRRTSWGSASPRAGRLSTSSRTRSCSRRPTEFAFSQSRSGPRRDRRSSVHAFRDRAPVRRDPQARCLKPALRRRRLAGTRKDRLFDLDRDRAGTRSRHGRHRQPLRRLRHRRQVSLPGPGSSARRTTRRSSAPMVSSGFR